MKPKLEGIMNRRRLLQWMASAPLAVNTARLYAAPAAASTRVLVVFMRGAYDAASLLVPRDNAFYYESRPNIAIARAGSGAGSAVPMDSHWSLHPALANSLLPLYRQHQLAFVPFSGTDDLSRSHFETQSRIELGQGAQTGGANYHSGFLNRLAAVLSSSGVQPAAFGSEVPQIFRGDQRVPNIDLAGASRKSHLSDQNNEAIAAMYRDTELAATVKEGQNVMGAARQEVAADMAAEMKAANGNAISTEKLEQEVRHVARFMSDNYNLGFIDVGGWDTHVNQGGADGMLANRFGQLGRALAAYADAMGEAWRHTTVVVISEFGRTFRENGNKGTDHGHGTVYWVMGGAVNGGRIAGRQVEVRRDTLFQDRDFPVLNEYRAVFAGLFGRLYGLRPDQLGRIFPGVTPLDLKLV